MALSWPVLSNYRTNPIAMPKLRLVSRVLHKRCTLNKRIFNSRSLGIQMNFYPNPDGPANHSKSGFSKS